MSEDQENQKFRDLLDQSYQWPDYYEFKFIIRTEAKTEILAALIGFSVTETPSKKGTYISISARKLMKSTQEVLDVYQVMGKLEGIMYNL